MANGAAPSSGVYDLSHVSINGSREVVSYQQPSRPVTQTPLREDYPAHAEGLLAELRASLEVAVATMAAERIVPGAEAGVYLEVETLGDKALPALDQRERDGIRVFNAPGVGVLERGSSRPHHSAGP